MFISRYYQRRTAKGQNLKPLKIMWATDAHVYADADGDPNHPDGQTAGGRLFYTAGQKLQNFVDDVNKVKPDLVFFTGDMLEQWDHEGSADLFLSKWNQIDPSIKKELTIGNHDLAFSAELANTEMAEKFGYRDNPIIAGSKYNQSFYLDNGINKVKIISMDTNIDENGIHQVRTKQMVKEPVRTWVKDELLNATTEKIIIFSHGGPSDNSTHFDENDQIEFKNMIDDVASQRPELNMYSLFGHSHREGLREYRTLGNNIKSYSTTPIVDDLVGGYAIVDVNKTGLKFEMNEVYYPYP